MTTPQSFFGGTTPKNTGKDKTNRSNRTSSAVSPNAVSNNRGAANTSAYKPKSHPVGRPSLKGKVDNRRVGQ